MAGPPGDFLLGSLIYCKEYSFAFRHQKYEVAAEFYSKALSYPLLHQHQDWSYGISKGRGFCICRVEGIRNLYTLCHIKRCLNGISIVISPFPNLWIKISSCTEPIDWNRFVILAPLATFFCHHMS
jgi:hypothetical protein